MAVKGKEAVGDIFGKAAKKALNKSKKTLPKKELEDVLDIVKEIILSEDRKATIMKYGMEYQEFGETFGKEFLNEGAKLYINKKMSESDNEIVQELKKEKFADDLVMAGKNIAVLVERYANNEINQKEFIIELTKVSYNKIAPSLVKVAKKKELGKKVKETAVNKMKLTGKSLSAKDIKPTANAVNSVIGQNALTLSFAVAAFIAFMEAYKLYQKAAAEYQLSHEERIRAEKECGEIMESILQYRKQMEEDISAYFSYYYDEIKSGFDTMDKAILNDDVNGYITVNIQIQQMLGYKAQFTTYEEFDDLMDSDLAFKL